MITVGFDVVSGTIVIINCKICAFSSSVDAIGPNSWETNTGTMLVVESHKLGVTGPESCKVVVPAQRIKLGLTEVGCDRFAA